MKIGDLVRHALDDSIGIITGFDPQRGTYPKGHPLYGRTEDKYPWRVLWIDERDQSDWFEGTYLEVISESR